MIKNYQDFKFDSLLESLLLESKLELSSNFIDIVKQIKKNKIAKAILLLNKDKADAAFVQNYIDTSNVKDEVTFTPDRKAQEFFGGDIPIKYKVTRQNGQLTHSTRNDNMFNRLGYTKPEGDPWKPPVGTIGEIRAESKSNVSENIYAWFVADDGQQTVINKSALVPHDDRLLKVWKLQRSNIKIGRFVRAILTVAGVQFTDSEIEQFVNAYKSVFDILQDAFSKFKLVNGDDIAYWYDGEKYESESSVLGGSCMAGVPGTYFNIYVKNSNCSLLILFSDMDSSIVDGKFISDRISGRALVWKTTNGDIFMDRIYTNHDSDISLFKKYAHSKGWWTKQVNSYCDTFNVTDGSTNKDAAYIVDLEEAEFTDYPFVDSLMYLNIPNKKISNRKDLIDAKIQMQSTSGGYSAIY